MNEIRHNLGVKEMVLRRSLMSKDVTPSNLTPTATGDFFSFLRTHSFLVHRVSAVFDLSDLSFFRGPGFCAVFKVVRSMVNSLLRRGDMRPLSIEIWFQLVVPVALALAKLFIIVTRPRLDEHYF